MLLVTVLAVSLIAGFALSASATPRHIRFKAPCRLRDTAGQDGKMC